MKNFKIYPSLGCARVGNGPAEKDEVIFTPEVPWKHQNDVNLEFLTVEGLIKKQAQRFYVYACDDNGVPTHKVEIGKDVKSIVWYADVANKKAFWYDFNNSLDLSVLKPNGNISPEVALNKLAPGKSAALRNPNVLNEMREQLVIKPGKQSVSAGETRCDLVSSFPSEPSNHGLSLRDYFKSDGARVKLGSIEYDDDGTLIFYGGDGVSAALNAASLNTDFADNSNWHDDICDGRITATVTLMDDTVIELDDKESAAWIATAPPDYAPQIEPLSTLYDMVNGSAVSTEEVAAKENTTFSEVFPTLLRLYRMQWVNQGDFLEYSLKALLDKLDFSLLMNNDKDPASPAYQTRYAVFDRFRNPNYEGGENRIIPSADKTSILIPPSDGLPKLPYYPGDGVDYPGSPMQWFAIPPTMFKSLSLWAQGEFDVDAEVAKLNTIEEVAEYYTVNGFEKADNAALLNSRAVLETMYGGGFHPGVELTWPLRHEAMYSVNEYKGPINDSINLGGVREFRINAAEGGSDSEHFYANFGHLMTSDDIEESLKNEEHPGWLWNITPGDLTKWMGIPWQSDAASCQAVYTSEAFPVPVWWPANLPVFVVPKDNYAHFKNDSQVSEDMRRNLFASRQEWLQTADTGFVGYHAEAGYTNGLVQMVYKWKDMGMVTARPVENPVAGVPPIAFVALNGKQPVNEEAPVEVQEEVVAVEE